MSAKKTLKFYKAQLELFDPYLMYFYHNNKLAWLQIQKNACSSWSRAFADAGWQKEDLHSPITDLNNLNFFGFLRQPYNRHIKGVAQFLFDSGLTELLDDKNYSRLLITGVYDEHTLSVSHLLPESIVNRTTFFIMDHDHYDYNVLVHNFLKYHNVNPVTCTYQLNESNESRRALYEKIKKLRDSNLDVFNKLAKNFFERDIALYHRHSLIQHLWAVV